MEKKDIKNAFSRLELEIHDFFWVYFGPKIAKSVCRPGYWDTALPLIRESVQNDKMSKEKLVIFGQAIKNVLRCAELKAQYKLL